MISKKINNQTKRKINKQRLATFVIGGIVSLMLIVGVVGLIVLFTFASGRPEVTATDFDSNQSSQIYDQNGELIGDVGETIRTNITYDELPTALIDAFVSVEDSRYFEHNGFDIPRFTKAIFNNLKSMSFSEGGSTFTMQLVDNTYFMEAAYTASKVEQVEYKVQEIFLSMETEEILSKERILELYLNKINFGGTGNIRGISKAAEYYFAKDVSELNLAESAMLAGIVNAPYTYDPFNFLDYATERRDTVLYLMYYHGYIDETEYQLATSIKVEDLLVDPNSTTGDGVGTAYQAYIDVVIEEVKEKTGYDPVYTPMKIYTYMDQDVQSVMDTIQAGEYDDITFPDDLIELASVSINNKTGAVNAIAGGRNYANGGSLLLNHATQQFKQPGSTVKPFLSYALAFELLGWSTSHTVTDQPIVYTGTDIVVSNATNTYNGQVTLGYAVGNSLNTPAIQTLEEVIANTSVSYVVEYLNSLGFDRVTEDNFSMGYAIGGAEFEVSVMELAGAMSAMLNGGVYNEPHTVYKVELMNTGEVIELDFTSTQVVSEETAFLVSELMYDNVYGSYYNYMQILKEDYAVYAKTGTTDYGSEAEAYGIAEGSAKDIWMVGGTSEYTVATWYGYEKAIAGEDTWISSEKNTPNIRGKITNAVLDANHVDSTPEDIVQPDNVVSITHILGVYPYTSPIEGMDEAYITTGLINKDFFQLQDPLSATVSDLTDFTVSVSSSGDVDIDFG
ncbi:MAG: transglycosylase domain-containing protein, partial [Erysipelotrichaceae bacterium]